MNGIKRSSMRKDDARPKIYSIIQTAPIRDMHVIKVLKNPLEMRFWLKLLCNIEKTKNWSKNLKKYAYLKYGKSKKCPILIL